MNVESKRLVVEETREEGAAHSKKRRNIWIGVIIAVLTVTIVIIILAFTVFKVKKPVMRIDSIGLEDLSVALDTTRLRVHLNVSVKADITIKNRNKVSIKYKTSAAYLNYRGQEVAEVPIPAGKIPSDGTTGINITMILLADRVLGNGQLYSDVISGALPLNTKFKISAVAKILFVKIHVSVGASCDMTVFISNRTVGDQQCKMKMKL